MAQTDLDPQFLKGLRLLYSSNKDSADQLKGLLDDVIRQKYGSSKMLCNTLHKKVQKILKFFFVMFFFYQNFLSKLVHNGRDSIE